MFQGGCKACLGKPQRPQGVKNLFFNRMSLERATIGGESPVGEKEEASDAFLSFSWMLQNLIQLSLLVVVLA
jgi:hypothetical protein